VNKLFGLKVRIEADRKCCAGVATIEAGGREEFLNLVCVACGHRCGRVSHQTANFLLARSNRFGTPTEPIILRREHYETARMTTNEPPAKPAHP
jgi:hypothetical protein